MFLTIEDGKLVSYDGNEVKTVLDTVEKLYSRLGEALTTGTDVMRSSSLDFPEEYTTDPTTLILVKCLNTGVEAPETLEECPLCNEQEVLSDAPERGYTFTEALCHRCRSHAIEEGEMDDSDRAYRRAIANGWAD